MLEWAGSAGGRAPHSPNYLDQFKTKSSNPMF